MALAPNLQRALLIAAVAGCSAPTEPPTPVGTESLPTDAPRGATTTEPPSPSAGPAPAAPAESAPRAELDASMRPPTAEELARYAWLDPQVAIRPLDAVFAPPPGFRRVAEEPDSFGAWLRTLPLRDDAAPVRTYAGRVLREPSHPHVAAVAELDLSPVDLQQCADSVIRLHAEWQWARGRADDVAYYFLSGDHATFARYAAGDRPKVDGAKVTWSRSAAPSRDRKTFRAYLDMVFNYASTISLAQRHPTVARADARPGDFFVLPGGPGHAVLILDVAESADGRRRALLGQGFLPAQDFHVLRATASDPWFSLDEDAVDTPFWEPFPWSALHRM